MHIPKRRLPHPSRRDGDARVNHHPRGRPPLTRYVHRFEKGAHDDKQCEVRHIREQ